jgi:ubiquinone/menaquinone biosynthesis C-methylase UbiE
MGVNADSKSPEPEEVRAHYASGYEKGRLDSNSGKLERARTRELLKRFLPPAPATILDVGGGPGGYACDLAAQGYQVHLIDITPVHVELAKKASESQPRAPLASAEIGDARALTHEAETADALLLFGPLYHLTNKADRLQALREAHRVLKSGGICLAVGISRFASTMDGLRRGLLKDPRFAEIAKQDLATGQHRNPTGNPEYFTDTFFHHPDELRDEVASTGFRVTGVYGVEGPGWLVHDFDGWWDDSELQESLLQIARDVESEGTLIGVSAHIMVAAFK